MQNILNWAITPPIGQILLFKTKKKLCSDGAAAPEFLEVLKNRLKIITFIEFYTLRG